jgi:hypothetical protein
LDVPFDDLVYEITHLSRKMSEQGKLAAFAQEMHEILYGGEKMEVDDGGVDTECLRNMLSRAQKLAKRR